MSDVLSGGPPERSRVPRWVVVSVVLAVAAVLAWVAWPSARPRTSSPATPAAATSAAGGPATGASSAAGPFCCRPVPASSPDRPGSRSTTAVALSLTAGGAGSALDRVDRDAASGAWSVIVRTRDGSLGRHSAVVTFPVPEPSLGTAVRVGTASGRLTDHAVTWSVSGLAARVRGDLPTADLLRVATATTIREGRPVVAHLVGLRPVASLPYRAGHVRELRYDGSEVGEPTLGGLVYSGVLHGAAFEDRVLAGSVQRCADRTGPTVVVSAVLGGNATLAWELSPGVVGYVGYSGMPMTGHVLDAMYRLARRAAPLDAARWQALHAQRVASVNDGR